jgi:hypothetical protein
MGTEAFEAMKRKMAHMMEPPERPERLPRLLSYAEILRKISVAYYNEGRRHMEPAIPRLMTSVRYQIEQNPKFLTHIEVSHREVLKRWIYLDKKYPAPKKRIT